MPAPPAKRKGAQTTASKAAKSGVKTPVSEADRLKKLFGSLCAQIEGGYHKNAIKTCDKILRVRPSDETALHTKLYLLLQTEQYTTALALLDSLAAESASSKGDAETSSSTLERFGFEKAYTLYRLHREVRCIELVRSMKQSARGEIARGLLHLEAQVEYRRGGYQPCLDLYTHLLDTSSPRSDEQTDLLTNLAATQSHLDFLNTGYRSALHAYSSAQRINIDELEASMPPQPPTQTSASLALTSAPVRSAAAAADQPAKKKVRMSRVPKGVVPGVTPPPDPERWLKKSERTNVVVGGGKHGKRKGAGGGGATQGSVVVEKSSGGGGGGGAAKGKSGKKK